MVLMGVPEPVRDYGKTPFNSEGRVLHGFAARVAEDLRARLTPACDRIEIAGSLRRNRPTVKDIEIVCIPKTENISNLLGEPVVSRDFLEELLDHLLVCDYVVRQKGENVLVSGGVFGKRPGADGRFTYGPKNKYLVHRATRIPVDLFVANETNWGMSYLIRTGSARFVRRVMTRFQHLGMRGHVFHGITGKDGEEITCPDEQTVFGQLGWDWMGPEDRE